MKLVTLISSTLVAGALAGVTPQIEQFLKAPPVPSGLLANSSGSCISIGWPTSPKPTMFQRQGSSYVGYVQLRNLSDKPLSLIAKANVQGADGSYLTATVTDPPKGSFELRPWEVTATKISLLLENAHGANCSRRRELSLPGSGFVRFEPAPSASAGAAASVVTQPPTGAALSCAAPSKTPPWDQEIRIPENPVMGKIVVYTGIVAFLVMAITSLNLYRKKVGLSHIMGNATWSFEKSWGANVTLGGALLMTLIGLLSFPERPRLMARPSYAMLQILFAAMVSMAPLVYNLIRREIEVNENNTPKVVVQGYVGVFLIAGGLVLWAAMGQIATLSVLTEDFVRGGVLDENTGLALKILMGVLFLLLLIYGFRSLYRTAKSVSASPISAGGAQPGFRPASAVAALPLPTSEWSIL